MHQRTTWLQTISKFSGQEETVSFIAVEFRRVKREFLLCYDRERKLLTDLRGRMSWWDTEKDVDCGSAVSLPLCSMPVCSSCHLLLEFSESRFFCEKNVKCSSRCLFSLVCVCFVSCDLFSISAFSFSPPQASTSSSVRLFFSVFLSHRRQLASAQVRPEQEQKNLSYFYSCRYQGILMVIVRLWISFWVKKITFVNIW